MKLNKIPTVGNEPNFSAITQQSSSGLRNSNQGSTDQASSDRIIFLNPRPKLGPRQVSKLKSLTRFPGRWTSEDDDFRPKTRMSTTSTEIVTRTRITEEIRFLKMFWTSEAEDVDVLRRPDPRTKSDGESLDGCRSALIFTLCKYNIQGCSGKGQTSKSDHPPRSCTNFSMVRITEVLIFLIVFDLLFQMQGKSRQSISKKGRNTRFLKIVK